MAKKIINKGEKFTYENITTKRPGTGICSSKINKYVNTTARKNYKIDDLI